MKKKVQWNRPQVPNLEFQFMHQTLPICLRRNSFIESAPRPPPTVLVCEAKSPPHPVEHSRRRKTFFLFSARDENFHLGLEKERKKEDNRFTAKF